MSQNNSKQTSKAAQAPDAEVTGYTPESTERDLYHVELDKPGFNPTTGEKLSKAFIQKFTKAEWNQFVGNSSGLGYKQTILWDPTANVEA
jgi:hypothetical protein